MTQTANISQARPTEDRDLVSETEAAEILNITRKSLQNMVYCGRIPATHYVKAITGKRFYYKSKLIG